MEKKSIRILVADRDACARVGVGALLGGEPDLEIVGEAADGREALRLSQELHPDVLLLDPGLPVLPAPLLVRRLRRRCPGLRVLALALDEDAARLARLLCPGIAGCALRDEAKKSLALAVRAVVCGANWNSERLPAGSGWDGGQQGAPRARELEVLALVAGGHTEAEVAERLRIGVRTVRGDLEKLRWKLQVGSRAELIALAGQHGLVRHRKPAGSGRQTRRKC